MARHRVKSSSSAAGDEGSVGDGDKGTRGTLLNILTVPYSLFPIPYSLLPTPCQNTSRRNARTFQHPLLMLFRRS